MRTPLYQKSLAADGRMGEYSGAETALAFAGARQELAALLHGCGVYDLGWRAKFRVSGKDRVRWLNSMVSNNIRDLPSGRGNYNFVLNPQGHIQGDLYIYNCGDWFLADTERAQADKLLNLLRRYIIMDQVELADISDEMTAIGVQGPKAHQLLGQAGLEGPLPEPPPHRAKTGRGGDPAPPHRAKTGHGGDPVAELIEIGWRNQKLLATRMADQRFAKYELWPPPAGADGVWDALTAVGAKPVGVEALEMFRIAAGIPRYGIDIRERDLPQETGQMQALNFSKGCYIGQEIVERIRSRGSVHRTLVGFTVDGPVPAPGTKVQAGGKDAGEITSALAVPTDNGDRVLALGYLRREVAKPGTVADLGGVAATVARLPFPEVFQSELSDAQ